MARKRSVTRTLPHNPPGAKFELSTALRLRLKDRLSYQEIGERLGVTEAAVRQRLNNWMALTDDPDELAAYTQHKQAVFSTLEQSVARELWKKVIAGKGSVGDLARALETVVKCGRLIAGESTENVGVLVAALTKVHSDLDSAIDIQVKD